MHRHPTPAIGLLGLVLLILASDSVAQGPIANQPYWLPNGNHATLPATFSPAVHGQWSPVYDWRDDIAPTGFELKHMLLMPTGPFRGQVVMWRLELSGATTATYLWDDTFPDDLLTAPQVLPDEAACAGMAYLQDGRMLVAGGVELPSQITVPDPNNPGMTLTVTVFNPQPDSSWYLDPMPSSPMTPWVYYGDLQGPGRFYPSLVPLNADFGTNVLCIGGLYSLSVPVGTNPNNVTNGHVGVEFTDPTAASPGWNILGSATSFRLGSYPRAYALSNGRVLSASFIATKTNDPFPPPGETQFIDPILGPTGLTGYVEDPNGPTFPASDGRRHFDSAVLLHELDPPAGGGKDRFIVFGGSDFDQLTTRSDLTNPTSQFLDGPSSRKVYELDLASNSWIAKPDMNAPRSMANAVVLPTGDIGLFGGLWSWRRPELGATPPDDGELWPVSLPEIYDPGSTAVAGSSTWGAPPMPGVPQFPPVTTPPTSQGPLAPAVQFTPRTHHSMALLLPDGRVLVVSGDDIGRHTTAPNEIDGALAALDVLAASSRTGEIYSPPYMFQGTRPTISKAPDTFLFSGPGADSIIKFQVDNPPGHTVDRVVLISPTAVTHHFSTTQRYIELEIADSRVVPASQGTRTVVGAKAPTSNLAPPGHYMLFVVTTDPAGNRIPSVACFIRLDLP